MSVSHADSVPDLVSKGAGLESQVLADALDAVLDDRVIVHGLRCVVFDGPPPL